MKMSELFERCALRAFSVCQTRFSCAFLPVQLFPRRLPLTFRPKTFRQNLLPIRVSITPCIRAYLDVNHAFTIGPQVSLSPRSRGKTHERVLRKGNVQRFSWLRAFSREDDSIQAAAPLLRTVATGGLFFNLLASNNGFRVYRLFEPARHYSGSRTCHLFQRYATIYSDSLVPRNQLEFTRLGIRRTYDES